MFKIVAISKHLHRCLGYPLPLLYGHDRDNVVLKQRVRDSAAARAYPVLRLYTVKDQASLERRQ